jgi:hypothetical protein
MNPSFDYSVMGGKEGIKSIVECRKLIRKEHSKGA